MNERQKERFEKRKADGQCVSCAKSAEVGVRCGDCATKRRDYANAHGNKASRDRRKAAGMCVRCGKVAPEAKHAICNICLEAARVNSQVRRKREKSEVFDHYGRVCTCCHGEFDEAFLTLNHVNNDGAKHKTDRGSEGLYHWAKRNSFPNTLETNCWNCNCARQVNGGICPHAVKRSAAGA